MDEITILKTKIEIQSRQINELMKFKHDYIRLLEKYDKLKSEELVNKK